MAPRSQHWSRFAFIVALVVLALLPPSLVAAQSGPVRYLYDDLNRLVRVVRGDGEAATYHYDEVGNILGITRESGVPLTTVVSQVSTSTLVQGTTATMTITGFNFSGAVITTSPGLRVTAQRTDVDTLVLTISVDPSATLGAVTITIQTPYGTATVPATILAVPVITAVSPARVVPGMTIQITGTEFGVDTPAVHVNGVAATVVTATPTAITATVPPGAGTGRVAVTTATGTGTSPEDLFVVPSAGLLAYWTFDVDGRDDFGDYDLTFQGGLGVTKNGPFGRALDFGGNAAQFAVRPGDDAAFNFGAADFSIALWARFNAVSGERILIEKCSGANQCSNGTWTLTKLPDNALLFSPFLVSPAGSITAGRWYHIAIVRAGPTATMYVNGVVVAQSTVGTTAIPAATDPLRIGERAGSQQFPMDGAIDEVGLWSRALTAAEVTALANASRFFDATTLSDDFVGTTIDAATWQVSAPLGSSTVVQNDALLATSDGTAGTFPNTTGLFGPGAGVDARCLLSGNFDVEVSYRDLVAPAAGTTQVFLGIFEKAEYQLHIKRLAGSGANGIQTVYRSGGANVSTGVAGFTGTSGRLRVTRTNGGVLTTYSDTGGGFQVQLPGTVIMAGDVVVSLVLLGPAGSSVRFDNFVVTSGTGLCLDE